MKEKFTKNDLLARKVTRAIISDSNGNYLFERRPDTAKYSPFMLQLFGGKVDEEDENLEESLRRELGEELGITDQDIQTVEHVAAELSLDDKWLSYYFLVILNDYVFNYLEQKSENLDRRDLVRLSAEDVLMESGPIIDNNTGGDIAFSHGQIIFENIKE